MLYRQHVDRQGMFYQNIETRSLSTRLTFKYPRSVGIMSETEGFIAACQDNVINTLVPVSCRACRRALQTLMHLLSACSGKSVSAYIHRHNAALRVLHYHLWHSYEIEQEPVPPYLPGDIKSVVGKERCQIFWNYPFPTVRRIYANQ